MPEGTVMPDWYQARVVGLFALVQEALVAVMQTEPSKVPDKLTTAIWSGVHGVCVLSVNRQLNLVADDHTSHDIIDTLLAQPGVYGASRP
jgi:hypothetical protein